MEYYIDLGSSTIKVYGYKKELELLEEHSIYFKNDFDENLGISDYNKKDLLEYFFYLKKEYKLKYENTYILATGIFRNLNQDKRTELVREFNSKFDLHFEIISQGIETYYLEKAMENDYNGKKVMVINMGGKSTEIVTFKNNIVIDRKLLKIGVAELLNEFPNANDKYSSVKISDIVEFVNDKIKDISFDTDYDCAIFTGGEERFEKLTNYNLVKNNIFNDGIHKYMISFDDFVKGNNHIFYELSLEELYNLMPNNPKWMYGARHGAILPQGIFLKANIKWIVPSDLNLINGVINDLK